MLQSSTTSTSPLASSSSSVTTSSTTSSHNFPPLVKDCEGWNIETPIHYPSASVWKNSVAIEQIDHSFPYFATNILVKEHVNYIGTDADGDPVVMSLQSITSPKAKGWAVSKQGFYRFQIPNVKLKKTKIPSLLSFPVSNLRKIDDASLSEQLQQFEAEHIHDLKVKKIGVLLCVEDQDENAMFSNCEGTSPNYEEFLSCLGEKIPLEGWSKFRGGLDVKMNTTGKFSVYNKLHDYYEVMFHISTYLPFNPNDKQQLERKRHLGNDICMIIFKEGNSPLNPTKFHSQFNHVFIVVQKEPSNSITEPTVTIPHDPFSFSPSLSPTLTSTPAASSLSSSTGNAAISPLHQNPDSPLLSPDSSKNATPPSLSPPISPKLSPGSSTTETPLHQSAISSPKCTPRADTVCSTQLETSTSTTSVTTTNQRGEEVRYRVSVVTKVGVPRFGPLLPDPPIFKKDASFTRFLLTKLINGERAAKEHPDIFSKLCRSRLQVLKQLNNTYSTPSKT